MTIWASLARIRNISRLVLAAIERDDIEEIERLSREGKALLAVVQPVLDRMKEESTLPDDIGTQLEELSASYQAIIGGLKRRRDEIGRTLEDVRRTRVRLRKAGLAADSGPPTVDRTT
jgi:hypothetical protein